MTDGMGLARIGALVAALVATPVWAQIDWDTDGDGTLSETEFAESFEAFDNLDISGDSVLTEDEFEAYGGDGNLADMDIDAAATSRRKSSRAASSPTTTRTAAVCWKRMSKPS
jgi:hypothetical protein